MNQNDEYAEKCVKACAGLLEDALDGGWTARGLSDYAKSLEIDALRYRYLRSDPAMLLHLSNKDFDTAIDAKMLGHNVTVRGAPLWELKRSRRTLIKTKTSRPPTGGASL